MTSSGEGGPGTEAGVSAAWKPGQRGPEQQEEDVARRVGRNQAEEFVVSALGEQV